MLTWDDSKQHTGCSWMIAKCDVCRQATSLAVGVKAQLHQIRMKVLIARGWQCAPRMVCPRCLYLSKLKAEGNMKDSQFECPACGKARDRILEAAHCDNPHCAESVRF